MCAAAAASCVYVCATIVPRAAGMLPAGVLTDSSARVAQWERLSVLLQFQPWYHVATQVNSGHGYCWCRLPEPGGSVRASSKRLATCLLLEPGGFVRASSKGLATCLLLEPGGSVRASSKGLTTCLLLEPGGSVHAVSKRSAMCVCAGLILTNLPTSRGACRDHSESEQGKLVPSLVYCNNQEY